MVKMHTTILSPYSKGALILQVQKETKKCQVSQNFSGTFAAIFQKGALEHDNDKMVVCVFFSRILKCRVRLD